MAYFHTDNHTWLNDDKCDTHSDFMCQLKLKPHCKFCPLLMIYIIVKAIHQFTHTQIATQVIHVVS